MELYPTRQDHLALSKIYAPPIISPWHFHSFIIISKLQYLLKHKLTRDRLKIRQNRMCTNYHWTWTCDGTDIAMYSCYADCGIQKRTEDVNYNYPCSDPECQKYVGGPIW
jgi:hypothetical protein